RAISSEGPGMRPGAFCFVARNLNPVARPRLVPTPACDNLPLSDPLERSSIMRCMFPARAVALPACAALSLAPPTLADDWTNNGGNAGRNGLTAEVGPDAATASELIWSGG